MATQTTRVTTVTNHNIHLRIKEQGTTKNALAKAAGIPATTFDRNLSGKTSWTISELGSIAEALGLTIWDIIAAQPVDA